jgi:predicted glycosyltransferase involved in capsule biosynthesis
MTISINMKFWHDGHNNSTRLRNVEFCWKELKNLWDYLTINNVYGNINLYDFSMDKIISDSIHISYPTGTYKKAEKTNIILKQQANCDFFMMIDSDAFFDISDYGLLLDIIKNLGSGDVVTFDLAKLNDNTQDYIVNNIFDKNLADWSYAYSGSRSNGPLFNGYSGGLGGVYICDTNLLVSLGGFDEKYTGWGGEDGDMLGRISYSSIPHKIIPTKNFAPYHLPHFSDWGNVLYSQRFA